MRYELPVETNADSAVLDSLVGMLRAGGGVRSFVYRSWGF